MNERSSIFRAHPFRTLAELSPTPSSPEWCRVSRSIKDRSRVSNSHPDRGRSARNCHRLLKALLVITAALCKLGEEQSERILSFSRRPKAGRRLLAVFCMMHDGVSSAGLSLAGSSSSSLSSASLSSAGLPPSGLSSAGLSSTSLSSTGWRLFSHRQD